MKRIVFVLMLLNVGCAATLVSTPEKDLHVIGYNTGTMAHNSYDKKFESKAREACGGRDYKVVEKSDRPETLKSAGKLIEKYHYYWVVKCL